jgi:hypothetical protein
MIRARNEMYILVKQHTACLFSIETILLLIPTGNMVIYTYYKPKVRSTTSKTRGDAQVTKNPIPAYTPTFVKTDISANDTCAAR